MAQGLRPRVDGFHRCGSRQSLGASLLQSSHHSVYSRCYATAAVTADEVPFNAIRADESIVNNDRAVKFVGGPRQYTPSLVQRTDSLEPVSFGVKEPMAVALGAFIPCIDLEIFIWRPARNSIRNRAILDVLASKRNLANSRAICRDGTRSYLCRRDDDMGSPSALEPPEDLISA